MAFPTTSLGACGTSATCYVDGIGDFVYWAPKVYSVSETTGTVVVIQIINTVSNSTRFSTVAEQIPSGYQPPPMNSAGTRTAGITYSHNGTASTTSVVYPTPFLYLPDNYTIIGDYQLVNPAGTTSCVRHANQTYDIPHKWQPPWRPNDPRWNISEYFDESDPLGWGYSYLETSNHTYEETIRGLIDVIPDDNPDMPHSVVKSCTPPLIPQPYVVTYNPNWRVVGSTSVVYEGDSRVSTATSSAKPVQVPSDTPPTTSPTLSLPNTTQTATPTQSQRHSPIPSHTESPLSASVEISDKSQPNSPASKPVQSAPKSKVVNSEQSASKTPTAKSSKLSLPIISSTTDSAQSPPSTPVVNFNPTLPSSSVTATVEGRPSTTPKQAPATSTKTTETANGTFSATMATISPTQSAVVTSDSNVGALGSLWGLFWIWSGAVLFRAM